MSDNANALSNLEKLKNQVFEGDENRLSVALNRSVDEIKSWLSGEEIDEDTREKINGIAKERLSE